MSADSTQAGHCNSENEWACLNAAGRDTAACKPEPAGDGGSAKEVARLRAALAVSEDQRRRDGEAAERAAAVLKNEIERLRARRPGMAPAGPTTPDRRSGPPARRGSASSGRSEDPPADHPTPTAGLTVPPTLPAAPVDHRTLQSLDVHQRWPNGADTAQAELDEAAASHLAEVASWQEHCAALTDELRWLRALAAQNRLPEPAGPLVISGGASAQVFPLDRYLSTSPPGGVSIQSAWQQPTQHPLQSAPDPLSIQSAWRQLEGDSADLQPFASPFQLPPPPAALHPRLLSSEVAQQQFAAEEQGGGCDASSASTDSDRLADGDMDSLLHALEAAVLKSSPASQVRCKSSRPCCSVHVLLAERFSHRCP